MSHEFESGFFGSGKAAWHGLGTVIEEDVVESSKAIEIAGLDWQVSKEPVCYDMPNPEYDPPAPPEDATNEQLEAYEVELALYEKQVPERVQYTMDNQFVNVRSTDHRALGQVGERYEILQNTEAFAFGDALVDSGEAKWHTAGSLKHGSVVWMLMKLPEDILIGGMEDERIEQFLLISNSHDGSSAVTAAVTPVRVVCQNTLSLALNGNPRKFKIRHTKALDGKLVEARQALQLTFAYGERIKQISEELLSQEMSNSDMHAWMDRFIPLPEKQHVATMGPDGKPVADDDGNIILTEKANRGYTMRDNMRTDILRLFHRSPNLENVRDTKYAAWQALVEYSDHHSMMREQGTSKADNRFLRIVDGAKMVQSGFEMLV